MTTADGYLDFTIVSDYRQVWCDRCAKTTAIVCRAVITQQTDPTNVVGRHSWTRCLDCEPYDDDDDEDDMPDSDDAIGETTGSQHTITRPAADRKAGMTLGEVAAWVQDAHRAGIDPAARVRVESGWRGQITKLDVTG